MTQAERDQLDDAPMPPVTGRCRRCGVTEKQVKSGRVVVSANGVAHHSFGHGRTNCGKDATGLRWWWPL